MERATQTDMATVEPVTVQLTEAEGSAWSDRVNSYAPPSAVVAAVGAADGAVVPPEAVVGSAVVAASVGAVVGATVGDRVAPEVTEQAAGMKTVLFP